jgi:hypothetical protein
MPLIPDDFCMYWSWKKFSLLSFHSSKILDPDMAIVHMSVFGINFAGYWAGERTHAIDSSMFWEEESRNTHRLFEDVFFVKLERKFRAPG